MAWTDPPTWTAATLTSSQMNQYVSANLTYLKALADGTTWSAVQVARVAAQSIPDATDTTVSFDTEYVDSGSWWTSGTDIVVPAGAIPAGYTTIAVHVIASANWTTNATGIRRVLVMVNAGEEERLTLSALSADPTVNILPTYLVVAAGDIITMQVQQTSTAALNVTGGIWVVRHAPAA